MQIITATYGGQDVSAILQSKITNEKLLVKVDNDICGDPKPGVVKTLEVVWEQNNQVNRDSWPEGTICALPKTETKRLGIFYSNNNNPKTASTISLALKRLEIAARGKADIMTCMWHPVPENPFVDLHSWYRVPAHLTQVLQILQILYTAREISKYEYVSFLEHDCLYPEGYFDYPEFESSTVLANMNYIGLCTQGWQERNQNDKPFSQLTMRFDDAVSHMESILPNALVRNSGLVEPQKLMQEWRSVNSSVHVNHGHHFTSHYSIYSKDRVSMINPYWGNFSDYLYLFES